MIAGYLAVLNEMMEYKSFTNEGFICESQFPFLFSSIMSLCAVKHISVKLLLVY